MKTWAVADSDGVIVDVFQADQDFIDNFEERVVEPDHIATPPWYGKGESIYDITDVDPLPGLGWYSVGENRWAQPELPPEPEPE